MCIQGCYFFAVVQFENDTGSAVESDGSISFIVISLVPSDMPFTVQVCTRESDPWSAGGLLTEHLQDFLLICCIVYMCLHMYTFVCSTYMYAYAMSLIEHTITLPLFHYS